jgi:hypothetical protein
VPAVPFEIICRPPQESWVVAHHAQRAVAEIAAGSANTPGGVAVIDAQRPVRRGFTADGARAALPAHDLFVLLDGHSVAATERIAPLRPANVGALAVAPPFAVTLLLRVGAVTLPLPRSGAQFLRKQLLIQRNHCVIKPGEVVPLPRHSQDHPREEEGRRGRGRRQGEAVVVAGAACTETHRGRANPPNRRAARCMGQPCPSG